MALNVQPHQSANVDGRTGDDRSSFRLEVPSDSILELAVWFRRRLDFRFIQLRDLGPPACVLNKPPYPRIDNISAVGMGLSFVSARKHDACLLTKHPPIVLVYFKVPDLVTGRNFPMTFMAGYEIKRTWTEEGRLRFGLSLAFDAVPRREEMMLDFVDVRKYGISELTKWCDCLQRRTRQAQSRECATGLCLDMLLKQLELAQEA